jgi:mevalonate kinase
VIIGPSGSPRSTSAMVERVSQAVRANVDDDRLQELGALTDSGTTSLVRGDLAALGTAMNRAHVLLGGLGVSTPLLDGLCERARDLGAYGSKLTGAGGGGAVIAIAPRDKEAEILAAWKTAGVNGFVATIGR